MRKTTNLGIWTHFGKVRGDARPWLIARWKAHGQLSIRLVVFFRYMLQFRSYEAKCVSLAVFAGVDLFALKFYLDRVVTHQPFLASEN